MTSTTKTTMKIEKIQPSQRVKGRFLLYLDNGEIIRVGEGEIISFALYGGMEVSAAELNALQFAAEESKLKEKAYAILSHRMLSRGELIDKLTHPTQKKDEPRPNEEEQTWRLEAAQRIADRLEEIGLLNDEAYAKTVVRHYGQKGYGVNRLRDELYRHRVPRDYWDDALAEAKPPEDAVDAFLQKRFRGARPDRKEMEKASAALARRGFGWEEIKEGMNRYQRELEEA